MSGPLVSICIPTYNQERFLARALESVLCQSYPHFELLVVDDCSTDRTREVALEFASQDPRIRFLANRANLGMVANWNRCLEIARGEYVKFLFGDDLLTSPDALRRMVEVLEVGRDVSLVASARTVIDEGGGLLETLKGFPDGARIPGKELIKSCLDNLITEHNPIGEPSAVMFRRDSAKRGFDPRYRQLVDLEMWFHLLEQGVFAYVGEPLCAFRVHGEQQTVKNRQNLSYIDDMFYLLDDYLGKGYVGFSWFAKQYAMFSLAYIFWKGLGSRMAALRKIRTHIPPARFFAQLALYRIYAPFRNILRSVCRVLRTSEEGR